MRWRVAVVVALLAPTAAAWPLVATAPIAGEASLRDALVLSGALLARAPGGAFAAPEATRVGFGRALTASYCEDVAGEANTSQCARPPQTTTGASLHVLRGGLLVTPLEAGDSVLLAPEAVGVAAGANLTLNRVRMGASLFAASPVDLTHPGGSFSLRPLGADAAIELRGNEGFRVYNGSAYTLTITGAEGARLEAPGGVLALPEGSTVALGRAPGNASLDPFPVFELLRTVQRPEEADLRGDLVAAFGPFAEVGALRNGALAMRANLSVEGEPEATRDAFAFVRVEDATVRASNGTWLVQGNATYLAGTDRFARAPGADARPPYAVPLLLVAGALILRPFRRAPPPTRDERRARQALRAAGLLLLTGVCGLVLATLLEADGLRPGLPPQERARLVVAPLLLASLLLLAVALPTESLARTALARRRRAAGGVLPTLAGLAVAALFAAAFASGLVALALRLVRL